MDIETLRSHCLSKKGTSEDFPFDETTLCFRVGGKIFCLTDTHDLPFSFNLKCDPEWAISLREEYEGIRPGYHMNKKHWNTVQPDEFIPLDLLYQMIDMSYDLVFKSLKKADKEKVLNDNEG